ncbi:MAG: hypothetical protein WDK96_00795 [Candidatus Paceibacterota bacterium]|jgi:hypothetical protein
MKKVLKELNNWRFIILIIIILGGGFYWFQLRPAHIRKNCNNETFLYNFSHNQEFINSQAWLDNQERLFKDCLRYKGLKN